ncbi:MAG: OmpA family protein [Mediterranea sp.]|jgi:outer membrane protein OmpA-like peptidoglycan-associated protein|nr:OmpA family protein [Mediterranea sp.]
MKKCIFLCVLGISAYTANAQTLIEGNRIWDNWSVGVRGGALTPLTHSAYFKNARPTFGIEINKQMTPVFALGFQGSAAVNFTSSPTAIDATDIGVQGKFNLMNLLGGYSGVPRLFEIEALAGMGWLHYYASRPVIRQNTWATRFGLNLNFNLAQSKAWTVSLRPAVVYDMEGDFREIEKARTSSNHFNVNHGAFELTAGLAYHFKTSSGDHHLSRIKGYDQAEVDGLNASVNALREKLNGSEEDKGILAEENKALRQAVDSLRNGPLPEPKVLEGEKTRILESVITFGQGKTSVDASQWPNVERVASYLKHHAGAKVSIKGYASPEGSIEVNERIARQRAEAVKKMLVSKYRIDESRITAEGQGVGNMFAEPDWNRVSICTLSE